MKTLMQQQRQSVVRGLATRSSSSSSSITACVARPRCARALGARLAAPKAALREDKAADSNAASTSGSSGLPATSGSGAPSAAFAASVALLLLSEGPAWAADAVVSSNPFQGMTANRWVAACMAISA